MVDFITTNSIDIDSVHDDIENFIICHNFIKQSKLNVSINPITSVVHITVYYKDGFNEDELEEMQESYGSNASMKFRFVPVENITSALNKIINNISNRIAELEDDETYEDSEYEDNDIDVMCVMEEPVARLFNSYINKKATNNQLPIQSSSLLQYTKIPNLTHLIHTLKTIFDNEFIYPGRPDFIWICMQTVL